jgi:hypothetical protein
VQAGTGAEQTWLLQGLSFAVMFVTAVVLCRLHQLLHIEQNPTLLRGEDPSAGGHPTWHDTGTCIMLCQQFEGIVALHWSKQHCICQLTNIAVVVVIPSGTALGTSTYCLAHFLVPEFIGTKHTLAKLDLA